jgi:hypothetical protein
MPAALVWACAPRVRSVAIGRGAAVQAMPRCGLDNDEVWLRVENNPGRTCITRGPDASAQHITTSWGIVACGEVWKRRGPLCSIPRPHLRRRCANTPRGARSRPMAGLEPLRREASPTRAVSARIIAPLSGAMPYGDRIRRRRAGDRSGPVIRGLRSAPSRSHTRR